MVNCDKPVIFKGVLCSYCALDFKDIKIGCRSSEECLCLVRESCIHTDLDQNFGIGLITEANNHEICKLGFYCCSIGLKIPDTICKEALHLLFIKTAASFPFHEDFVPELNCTIFFIQCPYTPELAFMPNAPDSKIFEKWAAAGAQDAPQPEEDMERE